MLNYYKTALRTAKSSKTLHNNSEFFNSCYLGGYVLECYGKLLVKRAMDLSDLDLQKTFSHNLKNIRQFINILNSDPSALGLLDTTYLVDLNTTCSSMINGSNRWDPYKRYDVDENIWDQSTSDNYQNIINILMSQINQMKLDGVIV